MKDLKAKSVGCSIKAKNDNQEVEEDLSIFEADEDPFFVGGSSSDFDVANGRIQVPFSLLDPVEVDTLEPLLLAQDDVVGADHHQTALEVLLHLLLENVVQLVTVLFLVDHQLLLQLNLFQLIQIQRSDQLLLRSCFRDK